MPVITIDNEVYDALGARVLQPFTDTPNLVLRRILGLDQHPAPASLTASKHLDVIDLDPRAAETFAESTPRPTSATAPDADRHHHASTVAPDDQAARRTGRARPPPRSATTSPSQHPANRRDPLIERPTAMTTNTDSPASQIPKLRPAIPPTQQTQGRPDSCLNFNLPDGRGVYMQVPYGASPDDIAYVMDVISGQLNALARRAAPTG